MKRKHTYREKLPLRNDVAIAAEPGTSRSRNFVYNRSSWHSETETRRIGTVMRGRHADLGTEKWGHESMESYPDVLGKMIATVIKEVSKGSGGLANLSRSLVGNSVSNGQMGRYHVNVDRWENKSQLHRNPDYKKPELNAALAVIRKTMKLAAADPFNRPVDLVEVTPDYFDVIKTPMDFGTICVNLENGLKYMNSADVFQDVQYIWYNCLVYNKKGDHILELMKRVKTFFMKYWKAVGLDSKQSPAIVDVVPIRESSNLRDNKRQKKHPLVQLANKVTQLQQNEAGSNQVLENRFATINMLTSQPQQSCSPPQASPEQAEPDNDSIPIRKKYQVRENTRCHKLLTTVGRIKIVTNELGQPIGREASQLTSFLGLIARDGNLAPLTYTSWTKMPEENKENLWQKVLTKFDIDPVCRSWVMHSLKSKWKNFKCTLKVAHYDTHATDEERLADRDERVLPDQWSFLVSQWSSEKWQSISAKAKASRAKVRFIHASGTKSFARLLEEERAKRPDGQEPSKAELFIMTRTRKDGQPVNEETAAVISQLRESTTQGDVLNAISSLPGTVVPTRAAALRMVKEKNAELVEMKDRLKSVEQTCSQMAAQMSAMMSMMVTMQKGMSADNAGAVTSVPVSMPNQSGPASISDHEVPAKTTRGRKRRWEKR